MKVGPVLFCLAFTALPLALPAQRQASLRAGVGVVRYAGGSSFSAFTLPPALQSLNPDSYFAVSGSASLLDSAARAGQARADLWTMLSHRTSGVRPAGRVALAPRARGDAGGAGG